MSAPPPRPPYVPVAWHAGRVRLLDQTLLPEAVRTLDLATVDEVAEAITTMRVRGAPAIGVTAAYGLALAAATAPAGGVRDTVEAAARLLGATRPTAVNLRWALDRVLAAMAAAPDEEVAGRALTVALAIHADQQEADRLAAIAGAALLPAESVVLTHCNTGPLATAGLGSALGVVIEAYRQGRVRHVIADETRPRLQGARLTAWELQQHGIPFDVIADGAAASLILGGRVTAAIVGADRVAANGDTANKVGTLGVALAAHAAGIPFYVAAPLSTFDPVTPSGDAIPIEERDPAEVLAPGGVRLAAPGASALNPAFDVTPARLVTAFVTEAGVLRPPFTAAIADALARGHAS